METYLRCFANACPSKWSSWLSTAEYWYNTCKHSSTGLTPFQALYGYEPNHFGVSVLDSISSTELKTWMQDRHLMADLIKQHLHRAKLRMKKQADQSRSERQFKVGDRVFVKLQPYVQSSLSPRANQKLSFKYFGPFPIIQRIGTVAYKLLLPATSFIHLVFHVSQLKPAVLGTDVSSAFPTDIELPRFPERILQHRLGSSAGKQVPQVRVQWSNWPPELATWENLEDLRQRFPAAPAWGQAASQGGGGRLSATCLYKTLKGFQGRMMGRAVVQGPGSPAFVLTARNGLRGDCAPVIDR
jgi:hypothetical protein